MSFFELIKTVQDKAAAGVSVLIWLMANIGGPTSRRRRILMNTSQYFLLYDGKVLADAVGKKIYRRHLEQGQRWKVLRVAPACRTVSDLPWMVITPSQ